MGTHGRSKPLVGLELNLSVNVIYQEILIACRRKKVGGKRKPLQSQPIHLHPPLSLKPRAAIGSY